MHKRGRGAIYSCSSGKSTPRAVERTTWLGRGPTVAIARDFCWLKTRWAIYKADLRRLRRLSSAPEPIFMLSMLSMDRLGPFADLSTVSVEKADLRAASVAKADLSGAHLRT